MNLLLFGLLLTVLSFITPYKVGDSLQIIDILPDFIGYLLVWFMLEKRRINKRMSGLYTATAVMTVVSFLYFLGQIKVFFADMLVGNLKIIGLLLDGVTYVTANAGILGEKRGASTATEGLRGRDGALRHRRGGTPGRHLHHPPLLLALDLLPRLGSGRGGGLVRHEGQPGNADGNQRAGGGTPVWCKKIILWEF